MGFRRMSETHFVKSLRAAHYVQLLASRQSRQAETA